MSLDREAGVLLLCQAWQTVLARPSGRVGDGAKHMHGHLASFYDSLDNVSLLLAKDSFFE